METKDIELGTLLSFTTGIMLTDSFGKVQEAAEFIVGYPVWTHQMPRVNNEIIKPYLLDKFPELAVDVPALSGMEECLAFLEKLKKDFGLLEQYTIIQMPNTPERREEQKNPLVELSDFLSDNKR